ncbi:phosphatidylserine decarboxylase proenzyme [Trifolium repens]|nr:phosphatidylserine decarboxylase proenzyme [Trifolium repens]
MLSCILRIKIVANCKKCTHMKPAYLSRILQPSPGFRSLRQNKELSGSCCSTGQKSEEPHHKPDSNSTVVPCCTKS